MTRETAFAIAERFGVPCVILAIFIWLAREAAVSVHDTVVVPIVESHTEFLASTRETLTTMCSTQERQAETLEELASGQNELKKIIITSGSRNFRAEDVKK